ncbi:hypothetical protein HYT24_02620 [Candidatus Pacearchaeota archaeon]|nr:hypothetical protein [Candidatus Pacearchaeota archaeon]
MKQYILKKEEYIHTFNKNQQQIISDYYKSKKFIGKMGITHINKKTKISLNRLSNWTRKNPKIPFSIRCIEKANKRNYFSIDKNSKKAENLSYLVGYNLGDGNIHHMLCNTWFYGVAEDLQFLNGLLKDFSVQGTIYIYKINNGKMCISDNSFTRLMVNLGFTKIENLC